MLGAQAVVSGNLMDIGNAFRFRIYSLNVETAAREAAAMFTVEKDDQIAYLLKSEQGAAQVQTATPQKNIAEGVWRGTRARDFEELADFTVTITGNEGILRYVGDDRYMVVEFDETRHFAKGTVAVSGNSLTGTLTHFWGNALGIDLGKYWLTLKEFSTEIGEEESEMMQFAVWRAEISGNVLTVTLPPAFAREVGSDERWTFIKQ
jgi:hypothetical protein